MKASNSLARRKALLIARADLERMHCLLAWHQARTALDAPILPERLAWARPKVEALLTIALPLFGAGRLARVVRGLSVGVMVYRAVREWRMGR